MNDPFSCRRNSSLMSRFVIRFLGTGDAFGSGGRLQSSIHVESKDGCFLIDCGATALIGMKRSGLDASRVGTILISHIHGDHYSGLPFIIKEAQVVTRRTEPLCIAGPEGLEGHITTLLGSFFPGTEDPFAVFRPEFRVLSTETPCLIGSLKITSYPAAHSVASNPLTLRIECAGRVLAYSGDTGWSASLPKASRGADLLICESTEFSKDVSGHMSYSTLIDHRHELQCRRIILTHMGQAVLAEKDRLEIEQADDGMVVEL